MTFSVMVADFKVDFRTFVVVQCLKSPPSNAEGAGLIPGQGVNIPQASLPKKQNMKQKQYIYIYKKYIYSLVSYIYIYIRKIF